MKRVLIVEHDIQLRDLMGEWLRAEGVETLFAQSNSAVVQVESVDAVIIDVAKPCDSHGCLSAWRQAYPGAAIIAVSGRFQVGDTGSQAMAGKLGVSRVLAKPFTRGELRAALGHP
jgi:DNA-binding response OmpR family regulator